MSRVKSGQFAGGVLASLLAALVVASLAYFIGKLVRDTLLASFIAATIGFAATLIAVRLRVLNPVTIIGSKFLDAHTGIDRVFTSLDDAAPYLEDAAQSAHRIDLFLHIGRREFGATDSLFYAMLKSRLKDPNEDLEVRVLHIDTESPYLSAERAALLGKRREKWVRDVNYIREQIADCAGGQGKLRIKLHQEPFVWRLFFFDDELFVSAYLHRTKNDKHAPVYRIHEGPEGTNSLYAAFRRYYDHLWQLAESGCKTRT